MAGRGRASSQGAPSIGAAPETNQVNGNGVGPAHVAGIQRARLLAAMTELSGERGVGNVTVAHVVARAGVSRRTFYELFVDREDCFLAALDHAIARVSEVVLAGYDLSAKWAVRVRGALVNLLAFLEDSPATGRLLIVESLGAGPGALQRREWVLARIITTVDQGREEPRAATGLPPMTAEGIVGGVLSVLHTRLAARPSTAAVRGSRGAGESEGDSLLGLTSSLMSMIVLPYLGASAAARELARPVPVHERPAPGTAVDPLRELDMRLTYRTVRVLISVAAHPGASNREIGHAAGIEDQGQISKLLTRLRKLGLIENTDAGQARGAPNSWALTPKGLEIEQALGQHTSPPQAG